MRHRIFLLSALLLILATSCSNIKTEKDMKGYGMLEVLKSRRAIRTYQDKMPDKDLIEKVLEAGTYAPTGMGDQSPIIVAVTNKKYVTAFLNSMPTSWEVTLTHFMVHLSY